MGSALATYGGLSYFGKSRFLSFMSCLHTTRFSYEGCTIYVHYYSSLLNGRIHSDIHLFIHVIQSLFFSLFLLCMLVTILSSKIYFLFFFLACFLIALNLFFLHGIRAAGSHTSSSSTSTFNTGDRFKGFQGYWTTEYVEIIDQCYVQ